MSTTRYLSRRCRSGQQVTPHTVSTHAAADAPVEGRADALWAAGGDELLNTKSLAARWGCSVKSLNNRRSLYQGNDIPFVRLGRLIRYRLSDVLTFEAKGRVGK